MTERYKMDYEGFKKKSTANLMEMMTLYMAAQNGEISEEECLAKVEALASESTLNAFDFMRQLLDEMATAYAVGDYETLKPLTLMLANGSQGLAQSLAMQIKGFEKYGSSLDKPDSM